MTLLIGLADKILARWRREGYGVWHVEMIVEGYDDTYTMVVPGRLSQKKARKRAIKGLSLEMGEKKKFIHVREMRRRS